MTGVDERPELTSSDVAHLIIDYVWATDRHGSLDFGEFVELWREANLTAQEALQNQDILLP